MKKPPAGKVAKPAATQPRAARSSNAAQPQPPLISGKWILTAVGIVIAAALICAYGTLCLLFYQGSWQLIFHPSRAITVKPAIPYQEIQFNYTETGKPQLTGWWIPAESGARYAANTILLLHDGHGSLSDTVSQLETLHALGINVFAFDYRGFGKSSELRPTETTMNQDADAALAYLTGTRQLPLRSLVVNGIGLGASVAAELAAQHPEIPALIVEDISPVALTLFGADARTKILPVRLLTSDRFNTAETLKALHTPKLLLDHSSNLQTRDAFATASTPKQLSKIDLADRAKYSQTIERFLDEVLSHQ